MARSTKGGGGQGQLRIIGGTWRGRKLEFTPAAGLRPTSDRIRETLFNWLAPHIAAARCADLFAGSGALGLEALSRGASHCDFIDSSAAAVNQIRNNLALLDALAIGHCHKRPAEQFLQQPGEPYDIVFVDPPFSLQLVEPVCALLEQQRRLTRDALVYVETAAQQPPPTVPGNWQVHREKASGGVAYRLFVVGNSPGQG